MNIDLRKFSHEEDIEAGAVKLSVNSLNICILSIYRAPSGNFAHFLDKLEMILNLFHSNNTQLITCGDININCLVENKRKNLLDSLLASYNLTSTVYFPTRIQNNSFTSIDNIYINVSKFDDYIISPLVNRLSDHDAQLITINDINLKIPSNTPRYIRNIDKHGLADFKIKVSLEIWDNIFDNNDVNSTYNSFLNIYLRVFYSSFPLKNLTAKTNGNACVTTGIRTSCKHKREQYLLCKNSNDPLLKKLL
jgi:hypothetical protein